MSGKKSGISIDCRNRRSRKKSGIVPLARLFEPDFSQTLARLFFYSGSVLSGRANALFILRAKMRFGAPSSAYLGPISSPPLGPLSLSLILIAAPRAHVYI